MRSWEVYNARINATSYKSSFINMFRRVANSLSLSISQIWWKISQIKKRLHWRVKWILGNRYYIGEYMSCPRIYPHWASGKTLYIYIYTHFDARVFIELCHRKNKGYITRCIQFQDALIDSLQFSFATSFSLSHTNLWCVLIKAGRRQRTLYHTPSL